MDVRTVNEHLKNIFASNELDEVAVIRKIRITAAELIKTSAEAKQPKTVRHPIFSGHHAAFLLY